MANIIVFAKSFFSGGAIAPNSIVKAGANDYDVLQAAAVSDAFLGITTEAASIAAERVDVIMGGIADLKINGTVTRGALLTSDASGLGVAAAPSAGTNNRIIGTAITSGVAGDVIPVLVQLGIMQG